MYSYQKDSRLSSPAMISISMYLKQLIQPTYSVKTSLCNNGLQSYPRNGTSVDTVFDWLIATGAITFSKESPTATIRGRLLMDCAAAACSVYMDSGVTDLV